MNRWMRLAISYAVMVLLILYMVRLSARLGISIPQRLAVFGVFSFLCGMAALTSKPKLRFERFFGSNQRVRQIEGWALVIIATVLVGIAMFEGLRP